MFNIPVRPEGIEIHRRELKSAVATRKWDRIYERTASVVDAISVHNETNQMVHLSFKEDPDLFEYDPIAPKSYFNIEANPLVVYAKRTVNPPAGAAMPTITTITTFYTEDQIANTTAFWSKMLLNVFGVFSPLARQAAVKIIPKATTSQSVVMEPSSEREGAGSGDLTDFPKTEKKVWTPFAVLQSLFGGGEK